MTVFHLRRGTFVLVLFLGNNTTFASLDSIGLNGIRSDGLTLFNGMSLTGDNVEIGQVEQVRPALVGTDTFPNASVVPTAITLKAGAPVVMDADLGDGHGTQVAGVMISTDSVDSNVPPNGDAPRGVAINANLYSSAYQVAGIAGYNDAILTTQYVATVNDDVRAINHSWGKPKANAGDLLDGNSQLTLAFDWSARVHDVLHVIAGNQVVGGIPLPTDNFNGLTVAFSEKNANGVYRNIAGGPNGNFYGEDAEGDRTSISLVAPGRNIELADLGNAETTRSGTSFATPHVTGTVALLQEYGDERIMNAGAPRWNPNGNARRHEVMKAVLMNSADKLIDNNTVMVNGMAVPMGGLLGMSRTILDQNGDNWLASEAYNDGVGEGGGFIPLDDQMGTGHLNATRALQQFNPGEYESDSGDLPVIGWDYGNTAAENDVNKYPLAGMLTANHFISITLAWDRRVGFNVDADMDGAYDIGDTFQESAVSFPTPDSDDLTNNLVMFLLPKGSATVTQAVAESATAEGTLQHIFFQIPQTGEYEIWVRQFDDDLGNGQDYALAWWYGVAPPLIVQGDYNGDQVVNVQDYDAWRAGFGSSVAAGTGADGNGNGVIDAADYVVWRDNVTAGSGSLAAVPEPSTIVLLIGVLLGARNRRRAMPSLSPLLA